MSKSALWAHSGRSPQKAKNWRQRLGQRRLVLHHGVGDAGELRDLIRNGLAGIDQEVELVHHLAAAEDGGADLGDLLLGGLEACGLQVEGHELPLQRDVLFAMDDDPVVHIIDIICLTAVEHLDGLVRSRHLVLSGRLHGVGERLQHAMVCDGNGPVAPPGRLGHRGTWIGQCVHG